MSDRRELIKAKIKTVVQRLMPWELDKIVEAVMEPSGTLSLEQLVEIAKWLKEEYEISPDGSDPWFRIAVAITDQGRRPDPRDFE
jgi:hypothetical protein